MDDDNQLKKLEEFKNQLIKSIRDKSPLVLDAMNHKDKEKIQELLAEFFVENLDILNRIVITRKDQDTRFDKEELDNIKTNLLKFMK